MTQPRYSLSYASYQSNICEGLSNLQQNGEFVDMTLAADGHIVKVHKMILSLASPYFKEIIATTQGHSVIYLNKVSSSVLTSLLEYIYTGQTHVEANRLEEFVQVAKDLHITGLTDLVTEEHLFDKTAGVQNLSRAEDLENDFEEHAEDSHFMEGTELVFDNSEDSFLQIRKPKTETPAEKEEEKPKKQGNALYTVSNQGTIQMIFNRYIYALSYLYLKKPGYRKWRCVEAKESKCPAIIVTEHDCVVKRARAHNHPFHDKRILKKMNDRSVFSAISDIQKSFAERNKDKESDSD